MAEIEDKAAEESNSMETEVTNGVSEDKDDIEDSKEKDVPAETNAIDITEDETNGDSEDKEVKENGHDKENSDEEDDDDDDDGPKSGRGWEYVDDDDEVVGSLEKDPLLTPGSKREVKKTQWLSLSMTEATSSPKEKLTILEGKGTKLGDMPRVDRELNQTNADDLKPLHRFLFGRTAKNWEIKKNIRKFNGFAFEVNSKEYKKKKDFVEKFTVPGLKFVCEILDQEKSGTKAELEDRLMEYLMEPRSSGKPVPGKRKKMSGDKKKRKEKRKKIEGVKIKLITKPKKSPKTDKKEPSDTVEISDISDLSDSDADGEKSVNESKETSEPTGETPVKERPFTCEICEKSYVSKKGLHRHMKEKHLGLNSSKSNNENSDQSDDDSENSKPPAKKQKVDDEKSPKKAVKKDKPKTKTSPKKVKSPSVKKSGGSDSDDEPLIAKKKKAPTNAELKKVIKKILEGADLEECTMKTVLNQVYGKYPDFDLTERKDFMKLTIREMIS